ncbi:MAG: acyl-CoA carboxylase subunit beta [Acidimicrobiales bacterium]
MRGRRAVPPSWDAEARLGLVTDGRLSRAGRRDSGPPPAKEAGGARDLVVGAGPLEPGGRPVVSARPRHAGRPARGRLSSAESAAALAKAAELAYDRRLPLVAWLASSGSDLPEGVGALHGWGGAAAALARCSGTVPVLAVVDGPLLSGPVFLLGLADAVVMTSHAVAYVSGPAAVAELTGVKVRPSQLGGAAVHGARSGLATLVARDAGQAAAVAARFLSFLPSHSDELAPVRLSADPVSRATPELRDVIPARASGSYDVRKVIAAVADEGGVFELRAAWAPQLVTALVRVGGHAVGVLANQPQVMSGTLDIAASQKGARFVALCDSFNLPLLTLVDTSGFMPGRDLEWRGIIRHGAELVFAYAEATVPRVCLVLRKAYGGAYIVMDSKAMGSDFCVAWPSAELAVMGAEGAVSILHRQAGHEARGRLAEEYRDHFLNPYVAAERGYVDLVIDPAETRRTVARCFAALRTKRERLVARKHGNTPL